MCSYNPFFFYLWYLLIKYRITRIISKQHIVCDLFSTAKDHKYWVNFTYWHKKMPKTNINLPQKDCTALCYFLKDNITHFLCVRLTLQNCLSNHDAFKMTLFRDVNFLIFCHFETQKEEAILYQPPNFPQNYTLKNTCYSFPVLLVINV